MGSRVVTGRGVEDRVVIWNLPTAPASLCPAEHIFRAHKMLVVDGVAWSANLSVVRSALDKRHRPFKAPFRVSEISVEVGSELATIQRNTEGLVALLYPGFVLGEASGSFRPMRTGPEPIHFDTFPETDVFLMSFVNVSDTPREYGVGPSFDQLFDMFPEEMDEITSSCEPQHYSWKIRERTVAGRGPLGPDTPRNVVHLAPGAVWFFNAKTVSHEVRYGEGAYGTSWPIQCDGVRQVDIVRSRHRAVAA